MLKCLIWREAMSGIQSQTLVEEIFEEIQFFLLCTWRTLLPEQQQKVSAGNRCDVDWFREGS